MSTTHTDHPVDSTTRECCQGVGGHTPNCPQIPLPPGATVSSGWDEWDGQCRIIAGRTRTIGDSLAQVEISAQQNPDGSIEPAGTIDGPRVFVEVHAANGLTPTQVRELAAVLSSAAAETEAWTQWTSGAEAPSCGYRWCRNDNSPGHITHWGDGETTATYSGPGSAAISCIAFVETDHGGPYKDEIHLLVKTTNPGTDYASDIDEGVAVFLSDDEALQLRALIDTAIANRAEIRGQVTR